MTQWPSFGVTKDAKLQSKMEDIFWRGRCSALDFLMQLAFQVNSTGWGEPLLRKPGHSCGPRLHLPCSGPSSVRCCSASAQRDALLYLRASCRARPSCSPGHMESWNTYHVTERQVSRSKNPECFEGSKRAFKQKINKNNVYKVHGGAWRGKQIFQPWKGLTNTQGLGCLPEVGAETEIQFFWGSIHMVIGKIHDRTKHISSFLLKMALKGDWVLLPWSCLFSHPELEGPVIGTSGYELPSGRNV